MYPKMCLVMVPISVQKMESLSSSEKKWQAIENLVHILLEWTLGLAKYPKSNNSRKLVSAKYSEASFAKISIREN